MTQPIPADKDKALALKFLFETHVFDFRSSLDDAANNYLMSMLMNTCTKKCFCHTLEDMGDLDYFVNKATNELWEHRCKTCVAVGVMQALFETKQVNKQDLTDVVRIFSDCKCSKDSCDSGFCINREIIKDLDAMPCDVFAISVRSIVPKLPCDKEV